MYRNSILLLVVLLCAWRVSGNEDTLYDDLEYSVQIPMTNCSDLNVCSDLNCKIVPKRVPFFVNARKVIKDSNATANWTCVEMETVDGICQNGLMEKAVMRHKMVQRMRNSDVCNSVQPIQLKMKNAVSNSFNFLGKSMNDQCKAIGGNKFECNVEQSYKFMADYIIGGYSEQTELTAQLQKNLEIKSDHYGSLNITSRLDDMYYNNASIQLGNNTSIDINETELNVFDQSVTSKAGSILKDQVRGQLGDRLLNDSAQIIAMSEPIQMQKNYQIGGIKCSSNTLCSRSNCDRIYKTVREKRVNTKWAKGAFWVTYPPRGYSCYDNRFNGCYCKKEWYVNVMYPQDRSPICQQTVVTKIKVRNTADFTLKIGSLLNNCVYSQQNNGTCTANVNGVFMIDVESGNNKDVVKATISSTVSLIAIVDQSSKYIWHMTIANQHFSMSSQLSNSLFVKTHSFFNQLRSEIDRQIIAISDKKLKPVIQQLSDHEFTRNVQISTHDVNSDDSDDDDIQPIVIGSEECSSNPLCSRNCELVPVNETYSVNINSTVSEHHQDMYEEYGWNCTVTLNNVSRCANDLYYQRQTRMRTIREEAHPDVCSSQVSPIVNLNRILVNHIHELDLNSICNSFMNGTTQQVFCQDIPASASWNFNVTAGGNAQDYQVNSTINMSIILEINHDLDQEQKKQSEYTINQRQNDDGQVYNIHDIDINGVEQQEWFLEMLNVVKSKVRSQIFNTILESSQIEDGLIKLDN